MEKIEARRQGGKRALWMEREIQMGGGKKQKEKNK
jgi:hypothetical protein